MTALPNELPLALADVLLAGLTSVGQWAALEPPEDGRPLRVNFGTVLPDGTRERAIGYYLVYADGTVTKYVGV